MEWMETTELAAIEQVRAGDGDAFRLLVERYSRSIFRLTYRMTGNEQDAEDMVQETFLRAYRQIRSYDSRAAFGTWLFRIATNCSLDLLRKRGVRRESQEIGFEDDASPSPSPERLAISTQIRRRFRVALARLTPTEQAAFILRHFEGVPMEEISQALGRSNSAARQSVFRAVVKLRRARAFGEHSEMKHLDDAQLVTLYYGEEAGPGDREHLAGCESCRSAYRELESVLAQVELPVPERGEEYGAEVWRRVSRKLESPTPRRSLWRNLWIPRPWAVAAAMVVLVLAAFVAGRLWPWNQTRVAARPISAQVRERILLVAVGDHLDRSQMVLLELVNSKPQGDQVDISEEQQRAQDLIASNRLYRQTASRSGDPGVATVLDELERVLLEVAHSPSRLSTQEFEELRQRVEAQGILFKVRVIDSRLQQEERKKS
jgi:RNA polymerase sigma-70 factor (ECF subfamily)